MTTSFGLVPFLAGFIRRIISFWSAATVEAVVLEQFLHHLSYDAGN